MKQLVYIRYEKKYRKWMELLGISISEEELKKGIEENEDLADYLSLTLCLFHFFDFFLMLTAVITCYDMY